VLPAAPKVRQKLIDAGLVDRPQRNVVDGMQRRLLWLETALPKIKPHPKLRPLLAGYAVRVRAIADQIDALAEPIVPAGEPCLWHGRIRHEGICVDCGRPDVPPAWRR
jgi:hypothetical protein